MKVVQGNQVVFTARSLNAYADVDHISIVVVDGQCNGRREKAPIIAATQGEYFHGQLVADKNGMVSFEPLPYRCDPYPLKDMTFVDAYEHVAEGKLWAIMADQQGMLHVVYQNDITNDRVVYQQVNNASSMQARIQGKLAKGYVKTKTMRFFANARRLVKI